jgi:hypothetical protein
MCFKEVFFFFFKSQAYACYPSCSVGRDQEDCGSKPHQSNSSQNCISKNPLQKGEWLMVQGEDPEFKPLYLKKRSVFLAMCETTM